MMRMRGGTSNPSAKRARTKGHSIKSEISPAEMMGMKEVLRRSHFNGNHLEIGTAAGGTLKEIINCYVEPRPNFFVIDPMTYFPNQFEKICQNLRSANIDPKVVTYWKGTSAQFLKSYETRDKSFDFIFIDGNHAHYFVMLDLAWCDRLSVGGVVCLHDNSPAHPGVGWAVNSKPKLRQSWAVRVPYDFTQEN
jgi:hypothetical protein